jgi:hypothetical protein
MRVSRDLHADRAMGCKGFKCKAHHFAGVKLQSITKQETLRRGQTPLA